jgi:hypothetical protein
MTLPSGLPRISRMKKTNARLASATTAEALRTPRRGDAPMSSSTQAVAIRTSSGNMTRKSGIVGYLAAVATAWFEGAGID